MEAEPVRMAGWAFAFIGFVLAGLTYFLLDMAPYGVYAIVFWSGAILLATGLSMVLASYLVPEPSLDGWRVAGVVLLTLGILLFGWVGVSIYLNQANCKGGESPVPSQGCGYVTHLVLYVYGGLYQITCGIVAFALGLTSLVIGRLKGPRKGI